MLWQFHIVLGHLYRQQIFFLSHVLDIPRTYIRSVYVSGIFYFGDLAGNLFVHIPQVRQQLCIFPRSFTQTPGLFFFQVFSTSLGHVLHFYMCGIAGNLFVHILQMLWKFHIFPLSFIRTSGLFFSGFLHIPGTCTAFLHVCSIFIQDIYPYNYLCTSCRCSKNFAYFQDIYPGLFFLQIFCTSPGHVLHLYMSETYVFRMFTHQISCVHPTDASEILHLPKPFTQTPGLFLLGFPHFPGTFTTFEYHQNCWHIMFQIFSHWFHCAHPADPLELPHFSRTFIRTWESFFWVFCTSPGHVLPLHCTCCCHLLFHIFSHQCMWTSCRCFRNSTFFWDIYTHMRVLFPAFLHIPRTCTTFAYVAGVLNFGNLAANLVVQILQMLWEFRIFSGYLFGFSLAIYMDSRVTSWGLPNYYPQANTSHVNHTWWLGPTFTLKWHYISGPTYGAMPCMGIGPIWVALWSYRTIANLYCYGIIGTPASTCDICS